MPSKPAFEIKFDGRTLRVEFLEGRISLSLDRSYECMKQVDSEIRSLICFLDNLERAGIHLTHGADETSGGSHGCTG